jgi:Domain of unknown function (DUF6602)
MAKTKRRSSCFATYDDILDNLLTFHSNECLGLIQRFRQIEYLIGLQHHGPSEGSYCEHLVREFLRSVLPKRYSVDTGFIRSKWYAFESRGLVASDQLDVIVHDTVDYSPIFRSGEFVVVLPSAVVAVIEVKKTLNSTALRDALNTLADARILRFHSDQAKNHIFGSSSDGKQSFRLFTAVFAFTSSRSLRPRTRTCSSTYRNRIMQNCRQSKSAAGLPDMIVVADEHVLFSQRSTEKSSPETDFYDLRRFPVDHEHINRSGQQINMSGQIFLDHLFFRLGLHETRNADNRFDFPVLPEEIVCSIRAARDPPSRFESGTR